MAKIEITVPGERIVEDFTALVPQPTSPSTARAPDVGLVELSYVNPTNLIPGPPGPPGPAGSRWYTGVGDPTITGAQLGDMYLDDVTGAIWTWDGTQWVMTGTDLSPDAIELLNKIKTVDGSGSGLDADTLDGHDSPYFLDYNNQTNKPATYPPTLPIPSSGVSGLDAKQASQDAAIAAISQFPEAPVDNLTYGRKNAAWATVVGGAVISDGAPPGPLQAGQLWWESDTGLMFIWYNDGNSSQWVPASVSPPGPVGPMGPAGPAGSGGSGSTAWVDITGKPATFPPTLPIAQSGVTNLTTDLAAKVTGTVKLTVASTAPSSPAVNDVWVDTT